MSKQTLADFIRKNCLRPSKPMSLPNGWKTDSWVDLPRLYCDAEGRQALSVSFYQAIGTKFDEAYRMLGCSVADLPLCLVLPGITGIERVSVFGIPMPGGTMGVGVRPAAQKPIILVNSIMASGRTIKNNLAFCDSAAIPVAAVVNVIDAAPAPCEIIGILTDRKIPMISILTAIDLNMSVAVPPPGYASATTAGQGQAGNKQEDTADSTMKPQSQADQTGTSTKPAPASATE